MAASGAEHAEVGWPGREARSKSCLMSPDSSPAAIPASDRPAPADQSPPTVAALFFAFAKMSLAGFGGVLAFARRGIVEEHRWMTADEFNETFALCHFLPGPNIVNLTVVFGSRFRGIVGGIAAFAGLVGPPMLLVTVLGALYMRFGDVDALRRVLAGVSCGAVGLLIAALFKMMLPLLKRRAASALVVMVLVFIAIGIMRLPLQAVLLVAIPISIGMTFLIRRRGAA
jgi:chromate transporter